MSLDWYESSQPFRAYHMRKWRVLFQMNRKWHYRDRENGINFFDFQPSKMKLILEKPWSWRSWNICSLVSLFSSTVSLTWTWLILIRNRLHLNFSFHLNVTPSPTSFPRQSFYYGVHTLMSTLPFVLFKSSFCFPNESDWSCLFNSLSSRFVEDLISG